MLQWDQIYIKKLKDVGISLYLFLRYVDDMVLVLRAIGRGWYWSPDTKRLEWSQQKYMEDEGISDEERTAKVLKDIASSINSNIQLTTDIPGSNSNLKMPVRNMEVWEIPVDGIPVVSHSFHKKAVASKFTILKRYAIAEGTKKSTIFQEGIRRLSYVLLVSPQQSVCDT